MSHPRSTQIQHTEFIEAVGRLVQEERATNPGQSPDLSPAMLQRVVQAIDANNSGRPPSSLPLPPLPTPRGVCACGPPTPPALTAGTIDYMEFVDVFHRKRSGMDRLLEQICRVFYAQDCVFFLKRWANSGVQCSH